MQTIKQRIDHALDVFRKQARQDMVIALTPSDWDSLCADVIGDHDRTQEEPHLTRDTYDGVPIRHLPAGQGSFVAHDTGAHTERRFPVEVLEPV